jgi:hypothetical protein
MHAVKKKLEALGSNLVRTFDQQRSMKRWMVDAQLAPFLRRRQHGQCVVEEDNAICMQEQMRECGNR